MCDFEDGFIAAVHELFASVEVKCCLFHFAKNIRKNASAAMATVRNAVTKSSRLYRLAQETKGRFRMLPLILEDLFTAEVVDLIRVVKCITLPNLDTFSPALEIVSRLQRAPSQR